MPEPATPLTPDDTEFVRSCRDELVTLAEEQRTEGWKSGSLGAAVVLGAGGAGVWGDEGLFSIFGIVYLVLIASVLALAVGVFLRRPKRLFGLKLVIPGSRDAPPLRPGSWVSLSPTETVDVFEPVSETLLKAIAVVKEPGDHMFTVASAPGPECSDAFTHRDLVELQPLSNGQYLLVRIHGRSGWHQQSESLSPTYFDSPEWESFRSYVAKKQGVCHRTEDGRLTVATPPGTRWDVGLHMKAARSTVQRSG